MDRRENLIFPIPLPEGGEVWPKRQWWWSRERVQAALEANELVFTRGREGITVSYKQYLRDETGEKPRAKPFSVVDGPYTQEGTADLKSVFGEAPLQFPKPIRLVRRCAEMMTSDMGSDHVLDYFAGSGTTGHAVIALNKEDGGRRRFILVEMAEYFERVLLERIRRVMYSLNWKDGKPVPDSVDGYVGLVKYQRLEQYEDVLDGLEVEEGEPALPPGVPLRYLYRPQEQRVRQSLDLSHPFGNAVRYGREGQTANADLLETFLYLRGWPLDAVRLFDFEGNRYLAARSGPRAVVLREIETGADDTAQLQAVLADPAFAGVEALWVNHDADLLRWEAEGTGIELRLITADAFDEGAVWS